LVDFKEIIAKKIGEISNIDSKNIYEFIETPPNKEMGDYAFPCFKLAKELKKAPQIIANDLKEQLVFENNEIPKIDIAGGYLNFYVNEQMLISTVLKEIEKSKENYGSSNVGQGKNIVIDYSSPNIAKPFHIGHLRTTVIGNSIYKIYKFLGYNCIGVNHLGDWGTQFGKLIEGYKRWGEEYNIEENPIDELTKIYIRINNLCKEDESVLNDCRNNFKKLEDGDEYCTKLWKKFRDLSIKEFQKVYDMLDIHFDSLNGEAFYADKMAEVVQILEKTGKLVESEGARIIDLSDKNMAPCIIGKTNGSTTYATRDLAAIMYRAREYDYDKNIYVTSYEQILHFKQVFEVAKLLGLDEKYTDNLIHVPFGMIQSKDGRMSTREGNVIKLEDLLNEAVSRVETIIDAKNPNLEDKKEIAKKIGIGAVIFNDLYNSRIKDEVFDWDTMLNFNGETGPYIQYIYVRTKSVLDKSGYVPKLESINFEKLQDKKSLEIVKLIYNFGEIVKQAAEKYEPYILARYLISLAQAFSSFYNENKIIGEEQQVQDARLYLTYATGLVLEKGANLLGIKMPQKM
jgi:arginyl-tRNA synthetase